MKFNEEDLMTFKGFVAMWMAFDSQGVEFQIVMIVNPLKIKVSICKWKYVGIWGSSFCLGLGGNTSNPCPPCPNEENNYGKKIRL
jgi:hypothetical protein